ncbi:MAG TPA: PIN domain-containing protein [Terriglobales bacterium]|nr:PIN domain-containing protein [Terriglobales bacterium]
MDASRHKEIMSHADVQFGPQWTILRAEHNLELRQAQFRARETHNSAAMLPAEAACYIAHAKALVVARSQCIADAYTAFNEPTGRDAEDELMSFYDTVVAARKSSFQGEMVLCQMRTGVSTHQLPHLLGGFERETNPALVEGKAILDRQRVLMKNRLPHESETKYVVDTSIFNWLTDGRITKNELPSDAGFAITHIQVEEINKTQDQERRARLAITQAHLHPRLLPTESFVYDVSRFDHAKWSDGKLCGSLKTELDVLNGKRRNNIRDALIAEVAIANGLTLLTADADLRTATEKHGGKVIFFAAKN